GAPQAPGLFDQEPKSHGVWRADGAEASDWQWSDRKHGSSGGQSATQRGEHLLVSSQRRGDLAVALVLQGGALEPLETYGHFTLGSVGSLTGTMGTSPRPYAVFATTGVALAGGRLSQGGRWTGSGCVSWCFRSSVICPGRKAERSGGVLPPWATQASKNARNQWRGLRPHMRSVWSTLNIIAARCALQMLPEP